MELLDADAFADPAFDCYAWVEEALIEASAGSGGSGGDMGALAQLVPRLALQSQSLAQAIHAALQQLSLAGPQLEAQLAAMQAAAAPLGARLDAVQADLTASSGGAAETIGAGAGASGKQQQQRERDLEHLVALHAAKQRLSACSQALVEAARWGRNARACVALVEDPEAGAARGRSAASRRLGRRGAGEDAPETLADCVREMRASLEVLKDMPGAWDRQQTMDRHVCWPLAGGERRRSGERLTRVRRSLCAQIESKMRATLDRALRDEHADVAQLQACLEVFAAMGRADEVRRAFCKARPARVHRAWFAFDQQQQQQQEPPSPADERGAGGGDGDEDSASGSSASAAFSDWLDGFYADVARMLQRESAAARELFGDGDAAVSAALELLENTLEPLAESFRDRLRRGFDLGHALRAFESTSAFAATLVRLFRALEAGEDTAALESSAGLALPAALLSGDAEQQRASEELGAKLLSVVFEPFRVIFDDYARFASGSLTDELLRLAPSFVARPTGRAASGRAGTAAAAAAEAEAEDGDELVAADADDARLEAFAQSLEAASGAAWGLVERSMQQCYAFTAGAAFPEAVEAAGVAVQQLSLALAASVPAMRAFCDASASTSASASPDWSKFHGTLALLKASGTLERDLSAMENRVAARVREQLGAFVGCAAGGAAASPRARRAKNLGGDARATALSALADPAQISAAVSRLWLRASPPRLSQFQQFAHEQLDAADGASNLFDDARRSVREWTREAQRLTFDAVLAPVARVLDGVPAMSVWAAAPAEEDGDLPTFGALPQEYITAVADRLLSLLPQLEPFADSAGLEQALLASRGAHDACVQAEWQRLGELLRLSASETLECQRVFAQDERADGAAAFVDLWTAAAASGALAALLRAVCLIPELSSAGARQLGADLGYFFNVLSAVGGEGSALVEDLRASLELSPDAQAAHAAQLREAAADGSDSGGSGGSRRQMALAKLNDCVAAKRQRAAERRGSGATPTFY